MLIGITFVVLAVVAAVSIPFLSRFMEQRATGGRKRRSGPDDRLKRKRKKKDDFKEMWDIEDIRHGVITLSGGRYRAILRLGSVDYHLMSEAEQHGIESVLMQLAMSLNQPVQFLTTTEMVDAVRCIADIVSGREGMPEKLQAYGSQMVEFLSMVMQDRSVQTRQSYAVVCCDTADGFEKARAELYRQASIVSGGLSRAQIPVSILDTGEIVDLLHRLLNRWRTARPSEAAAAGGIEPYKYGKEGIPLAFHESS
jgi:hypothetical protein